MLRLLLRVFICAVEVLFVMDGLQEIGLDHPNHPDSVLICLKIEMRKQCLTPNTLHLQCVSEASENEFSMMLFSLLAWLNSNSPRSFQHFRQTLRRNLIWIRQQVKNFPIDPHCKNQSTFDVKIHRMTLPKVKDFYNGGMWGNYSSVVKSDWNLASKFV